MNEQAPLLEEEYEEEQWFANKRSRYAAYGLGGIFGLLVLWAFAFYLPLVFIPEPRSFEGIPMVRDLDVSLEPMTPEEGASQFEPWHATKAGAHMKKRLILIGDVHGHYKPFRRLLKKINYSNETDHLLLLGDFITKGPHSVKVLEYLIDNNIDCIIGNHEYYVMNHYAKFHRLEPPFFIGHEQRQVDFLVTGGFNDDPEFLLAKKLQPHHMEYINRCSVIKTLGPVPQHSGKNQGSHKYSDGIAVHGGLRWDIENLERQIPVDCLEMRSLIGPFYNESTDDPKADRAVLWSKIWNLKQKEKDSDHQAVYYGHDAHRGLNLKRFAKGLDSGCDTGGELTAMVIWQERARKRTVYKEQVVQVTCDDQ